MGDKPMTPTSLEVLRERQRLDSLNTKAKREAAKARTTPQEIGWQLEAAEWDDRFKASSIDVNKRIARREHHAAIDKVIRSMHRRGEIGVKENAPHRHTKKQDGPGL